MSHRDTGHRDFRRRVTISGGDITVINGLALICCPAHCYDADELWRVASVRGPAELPTRCSEHRHKHTHTTMWQHQKQWLNWGGSRGISAPPPLIWDPPPQTTDLPPLILDPPHFRRTSIGYCACLNAPFDLFQLFHHRAPHTKQTFLVHGRMECFMLVRNFSPSLTNV